MPPERRPAGGRILNRSLLHDALPPLGSPPAGSGPRPAPHEHATCERYHLSTVPGDIGRRRRAETPRRHPAGRRRRGADDVEHRGRRLSIGGNAEQQAEGGGKTAAERLEAAPSFPGPRGGPRQTSRGEVGAGSSRPPAGRRDGGAAASLIRTGDGRGGRGDGVIMPHAMRIWRGPPRSFDEIGPGVDLMSIGASVRAGGGVVPRSPTTDSGKFSVFERILFPARPFLDKMQAIRERETPRRGRHEQLWIRRSLPLR